MPSKVTIVRNEASPKIEISRQGNKIFIHKTGHLFNLPIATKLTLGGVIPGTGLSVDENGVINVTITEGEGGGGDGVWGSITGTITDQTDLVAALGTKVTKTGDETIAGTKTFSSPINLYDSVLDQTSVISKVDGGVQITGDIYATGNIIAFTSGGEPDSWWSSMPYATALTVGGIKVGDNLSITEGVLSADAVAGEGTWGSITGTIADQTDLYDTFALLGHDHDTVYVKLDTAQTITGVKTFYSGQKINNPANSYAYTITAAAISANRTLNLPLITGTDTLATLGLGQAFTGANTFSGANTFYSGQKINNPANTYAYTLTSGAISANRTLNLPVITGTDTLMTLGLAQTITGGKTFGSTALLIRNPADTYSYTIAGGAITAARTITLPVVTGNDTFATLGMVQTFTGATTFSATPVTLSANSAILSFSSATGVKQITTGGTTNLALMPGGNVGIGTTTPISKIELYGSGQNVSAITDAGDRGSFIMLNHNSSSAGAGGAIIFGNQQTKIANTLGWAAIKGMLTDGSGNAKGDLIISTRNATTDTALTERIRILAGGNMGISNNSPSERLDVTGNILASGEITAYSDVRLKKNLIPINGVLEKLNNVIVYKYNTLDNIDKDIHFGVVAQELEKEFPELVKSDPKGMKHVNYMKLSVVLLQGLKELNEKWERQ